jgi:hypothetical protein
MLTYGRSMATKPKKTLSACLRVECLYLSLAREMFRIGLNEVFSGQIKARTKQGGRESLQTCPAALRNSGFLAVMRLRAARRTVN